MSKRIICGDLHINERSISEINEIFEKDIFPIEADSFIQLGDFFHSNTPTPLEEKFGSELILKIKQYYKEVIILAGNGEHEYIRGTAIVEHLQSLGIKVIKEDYIEDNILYGHWMVKEAKLSFGKGKYSKNDLNKYEAVFLGHEHIHEIIMPNIVQLPAIRYVTFGEVGTIKGFILLEDKIPQYQKIEHCIPMIDVTDLSQLEQIDARTKVRVIFSSFEDYKKNASYVNRLGKKFFEFKIQHKYLDNIPKIEVSNKKDTMPNKLDKSNIIQSYIDKIEDKDVKIILSEQFKKEQK